MKIYLYITYLLIVIQVNNVFAKTPGIIDSVEKNLPWAGIGSGDIAAEIGWNLISLLIGYVAVIAVISLMISWIMYLISGWEEEKVKKAKNWIIWSLVWVLISISAIWIIEIINNITIWK